MRLSGGQRQRIALARALVKNPPILILDEATSMFDPEAEASFISESQSHLAQRTVILITHRPSSLAACRTESFHILGIVENGRFRLPWRFDLAALAPVDPANRPLSIAVHRAPGLPRPRQAGARTNIRFRFQAIVTRPHSPRTFSSPRSEN